MTHRAAGTAIGGVPRIWLLPTALLAVFLGITAAGVLSRSLLIDLVAWWPAWLGILILTVATRGMRIRRVRVSGLVPLLATGVLVAFVVGHLSGWAVMPSAAISLVGPPADVATTAALSARIDGEMQIGAGSEFLYTVEPIRRGGQLGIPDAEEQTQGSSISVQLSQPPDPGFYVFSGWDVELSTGPSWNLTLEGVISGDLARLNLTGLQLGGEGTLALGPANGPIPASVSGVFELVVEEGTAVRVVGDAVVPAGWEEVADGWQAPVPGNGWVLSVAADSSVTITEG